MSAARFEILVLTAYAVVMIACAWALSALTNLPTWLAIVGGALGGLVLALLANVFIVMVRQFYRRPDD
jgi:ABC-type branched-subunit amino acid transport system permease subunit